jgi:hypothetical protein
MSSALFDNSRLITVLTSFQQAICHIGTVLRKTLVSPAKKMSTTENPYDRGSSAHMEEFGYEGDRISKEGSGALKKRWKNLPGDDDSYGGYASEDSDNKALLVWV